MSKWWPYELFCRFFGHKEIIDGFIGRTTVGHCKRCLSDFRREPEPDVCIEIDMDPKDMRRAVKAGLFEKQTVYRLTEKGKDSLLGYMK